MAEFEPVDWTVLNKNKNSGKERGEELEDILPVLKPIELEREEKK